MSSSALRTAGYYITAEEYLAGERISQTKHEYLAGVVYAMAGASRDHNIIATNILSTLHNQLRGKSCAPFGMDMRLLIRSGPATLYYYPDVMVDCRGTDNMAVEEPSVIFEVLSPDTERTDRAEKLRNYQSLPSLSVYGLVDQFQVAVTIYRRTDDGWKLEFLTEKSDVLDLSEIGCALPLAAIYDRMRF